MRLFVVDPHPIFRRGLVACLLGIPEVETVGEGTAVIAARADPACAAADLVVIDGHAQEALAFVSEVTLRGGAQAIVVGAGLQAGEARRALRAGATGVLAKESMTPEALAGAVHAVATSSNLVISAPLDELLGAAAGAAGSAGTTLTSREQRVLAMLSEGASIRQIAEELHYSERTVKTVVRTSVGKLNARSRSHAIAEAVRTGLI